MSQQLISRSTDLTRLRDEGYNIEIRSNYLVVNDVPYLNANKEVKFGALVSELTLAGDVTTRPGDHVAHFVGDHPCKKDGSEITEIKHQSQDKLLGQGLVVKHSFSSKPPSGYADYYEKMHTYFAIISSPARSMDPTLTGTTPLIVKSDEDESVFAYADTASSRLEINMVTKKLELEAVAIIGLGGTGSYVLDFVAKTPVKEIHLYDGDLFLQHNAFRSPGAPSIDDLRAKPTKVEYFKKAYSKMHRNIHDHAEYVDDANVDKLTEMDFVFICLDRGKPRRLIIDKLEEAGIPFVDVGMGIQLVDDSLGGIVRVTTSTPDKREHVAKTVPMFDGNEVNDYSTNIQIADLNALNAALAVIKWKKLFGFYFDFEYEHTSTYTIDGNILVNEDRNEAKLALEV